MAYVARTDRPSDKAARYLEVEEEILAVLDASGALIAVLDVDATTPSAFDTEDQVALERLMAKVFSAA